MTMRSCLIAGLDCHPISIVTNVSVGTHTECDFVIRCGLHSVTPVTHRWYVNLFPKEASRSRSQSRPQSLLNLSRPQMLFLFTVPVIHSLPWHRNILKPHTNHDILSRW